MLTTHFDPDTIDIVKKLRVKEIERELLVMDFKKELEWQLGHDEALYAAVEKLANEKVSMDRLVNEKIATGKLVWGKPARLSNLAPEQYTKLEEQYTKLAEMALNKVAKDNGIEYNADDLTTAIDVVEDQVLWRECLKAVVIIHPEDNY